MFNWLHKRRSVVRRRPDSHLTRRLCFEQFEERRLMAIVEGPVGDAEVRANTTTDGHQQSGSVAFEPDGDCIVVWHHVSGFGGTRVEGIRMQRYNAAGVAQGGETTLVTDARLPNIVTDGAGNFLVTYTKNSGSRWAQWYHNNGAPRGGEFAIEGNSLFRDE